jgi:hypothetical protein
MKSSMNGDLHDQVMRYLDDTPRRRLVHVDVCDAIEGFCDATCGCEGSYFDLGVCYRCGNRIVAQFDILKEDGV